ncbi:MAG TPA: hypothetical protein VF593_12785 [Chthoniobacteraceae bacterium]|jgi:hypothetical protein
MEGVVRLSGSGNNTEFKILISRSGTNAIDSRVSLFTLEAMHLPAELLNFQDPKVPVNSTGFSSLILRMLRPLQVRVIYIPDFIPSDRDDRQAATASSR